MTHMHRASAFARACLTLLGFVVWGASGALAQAGPELDAARRSVVLDSLSILLERLYVFPDVAERAAADLRVHERGGGFDAASDPETFARSLTERLLAVTHDKHLRVRVGGPRGPGERVPGGRPSTTPGGRRPRAAPSPAAAADFLGRTERLDGDIAYVEIRTFGVPAEFVREAARDAMSAAADAKALILDVRANGGGRPDAVALMCSYLFGDEPVHLNSLYFRPANRTDSSYTDPGVAGRKFGPTKPVYVLTSSRTFSAAEEFSYDLQALGRAVIVGETTGGGANPGGPVPLPHGLSVFLPSGRAINPITGTNWEGVGVKPDVAVPADQALETAHRLARGGDHG